MKRREALKNTALLGGSTVLTGALVSLLQACQQTSRLDWKPQFLQHPSSVIQTMINSQQALQMEIPGVCHWIANWNC